jgi:hypothetical protein
MWPLIGFSFLKSFTLWHHRGSIWNLGKRTVASLMLALFIYLLDGCTEKKEPEQAKEQPRSAENMATSPTDSESSNHAKPLEQIPALVPVPEPTEWLLKHFAWYAAPQGTGPVAWSGQEKNIQPEACGSCHQEQYKDWKESLHHKAMGPSVLGQLLDMELDAPILAITCQRCHAPLAEQIPYLEKGKANPIFIPGLREKGLVCAGCHVRNHEHFGPPPRKPKVEGGPHGGFTIKTEFESPAFCASCHDFKPGGGMHGKLVQETAEEWRRTPFAAEGKTCQSCHMPDRRHLWKGIHDSSMVSSAVSISVGCEASSSSPDSIFGTLTLTNVGAGHRFPTYTEPQVKLIFEQLDAKDMVIQDTHAEGIIARRVTEEMDRELFDTRLLPGETFTFPYRYPKNPRCVKMSARVEVWPDEAYRLYFKKMLATPSLRPEMPAVIESVEAAERQNTDSRYILWERKISL